VRAALPSRLAPLALVALSALPALGGCAPAAAGRELLNSERIERRFGSYGVEVLESDACARVSNLWSGGPGDRVGRTFAVVSFAAAADPRVAAEHREIVAGGSIGAVFRRHGWEVARRHRLLGERPPPRPGDRLLRLMRLGGDAPLAFEVYTLVVSRDGERLDYATIAEVHHPEHLRLADLRELYGARVPVEPGGDRAVAALLELVERATRGPLPLDVAAAGDCPRLAAP
jgi:hypothetical protein